MSRPVTRGKRGGWALLTTLATLAASSVLGQTTATTPGTEAANAADSDDAALMLADQARATTEHAKDWQLSIEVALGQTRQRHGLGNPQNQRLSLDLHLDTRIGDHWRAVFSDQLDQRWQHRFNRPHSVNTLREAYLSWQPRPERAIDVGRINVRHGVATGYNPTDFFRAGAIRSVVSVDPGSLKKNRLGSVMLRGQTVWRGGSLTALVSPKLADAPSTAAFDPDLGATNNRHRWLLAAGLQLAPGLTPQWLAYGGQGTPSQLGFNLTTLLGQATVVFAEWAGGRSQTQLAQALHTGDDSAWHNRLATGLTYTSANKLSLTLEYDHNSAALSQANWNALMRGPPAAYAQYRSWTHSAQELPTRQALGVHALWQDAWVPRLDLSAMLRHNLADRSRLAWLEARYHFDHADLGLQWQVLSGRPGSEYGAAPQRQAAQVLVRYYF